MSVLNSIFAAEKNFQPASALVCKELLDCLADISNSPQNTTGVNLPSNADPPSRSTTKDDFEDAKPELYAGNLTVLTQRKEDICNGPALLNTTSYNIINGPGPGCRAMPHYPTNFSDYFKSFEPGYPFGQPYETLTGWAIQNGFDARTTAGATNILIKGFLLLAKVVLDAIQDRLPSSFI